MHKKLTLTTVFEDNHFIIVDKPAGLLSQGNDSNDPNCVDLMREHFGRHYVGLIHRLDRNTSGLMVIAKRSKAAARITQQLQSGRLIRDYLGWAEGTLGKPDTLTHWLKKDERSNKTGVFNQQKPDTKKAQLHFEPLRNSVIAGLPITLLRLRLDTGRSHQIRAQLSRVGHPLVGDGKYGSQNPNPERLALHSCSLEFEHPMSNEKLIFESELPEDIDF